jgi:hypothetical protein
MSPIIRSYTACFPPHSPTKSMKPTQAPLPSQLGTTTTGVPLLRQPPARDPIPMAATHTRCTRPTRCTAAHPYLARQARQAAQEEQSNLGLLGHGQAQRLLRAGRWRLRSQQQAWLSLNGELQRRLLHCTCEGRTAGG